jgi:nitrogen fixation NifU-like protein
MNELGELYQQVILDHNRQPRNFHPLESANRQAEGHNPLCGDRLTLYLRMTGDVIEEIGFMGSGCAISKASASLMTEALKGKTREQAEALFQVFHGLVTGDAAGHEAGEGGGPGGADLGKLVVFSGVRNYPVRVKCATLAWHTLRAALENAAASATTE